MTALISEPRRELIPGFYDMAINHLRTSGIRVKREVKQIDVDKLTVDDVYGCCPFLDLLELRPPLDDWKALIAWQKKMDKATEQKGMNEWAERICTMIHDRNNPKAVPHWRR